MEMLTFNINDGYPEAIIRGWRASFLTRLDYDTLKDCNNLSDFKMQMEDTDYNAFIQSEINLTDKKIVQRMREKLSKEFEHVKSMAGPDLYRFMDTIQHRYVIDNVIMLIEGGKKEDRERITTTRQN